MEGRRIRAVLGSAFFLLIAPGTIAGWLPWWIARTTEPSPLLAAAPFRLIGVVLSGAGLLVLLDSFARFALQGIGTPAPVFPTRHLVVTGWYRYVRNPMYVAVLSLIFGQGFFFARAGMLLYGLFVWLCFHLFVLGYEEPKLRATFGDEYAIFCAHVPRWVPRGKPWSFPGSGGG